MPMPGTPPPDNQGIVAGDEVPSSSQGQPSIWRRILAGGLLGASAGMAQKNPYAGAVAGVDAVLAQQQRGFENKRQTDADQRQQTEIQQRQQQIDIDKQNSETSKTLGEANAALALTHKMLIEKQMQQLPDEQRTKISEAWSHITQAYKNSGLTMSTESDDTKEAQSAYLEQVQKSGGKLTDFIFSPDPTNGKIAVFQRDDSKVLDKEDASAISKSTGINIPEGTPVHTADVILAHGMQANTEKEVARIHANAQTESARIAADSRLDVAETRAESATKKGEDYKTLAALQGRLTKANEDLNKAESKRRANHSGGVLGMGIDEKKNKELDRSVDDAKGQIKQIQTSIDEVNNKLKGNAESSLSSAASSVLKKYGKR